MKSPSLWSKSPKTGGSKSRVLTKAEKTSRPSLSFYREFFADVLPQLQARIPEETNSDNLIEVLAEWGGDVDTAERKYRETVEWRKTYLPVPRDEVQLSIDTGKFTFHGFDKVGRGVVYFRTRLHDPKKFTPQETLRHAVYNYELLLDRLAKEGRTIREALVVVDRSGASSKNTDVEFLKLFYAIFKDHYPARGEVFLIYGVNWIFKGVWAMVKPFLDVKAQGGTFLLKDRREMLDFIDEDQLPEWFGGEPSSPVKTPTKSPVAGLFRGWSSRKGGNIGATTSPTVSEKATSPAVPNTSV